jgi:hypothetical protein
MGHNLVSKIKVDVCEYGRRGAVKTALVGVVYVDEKCVRKRNTADWWTKLASVDTEYK